MEPSPVSYTHLRFYVFLCVCILLVVQELLVFGILCVRLEYPRCAVYVCVCVVCFNEVVCKGGFISGVYCLCVFNVSLFDATSSLAYVVYVAI